jgi:hypothetical protein
MKPSFHILIPFLPLFCNCQFRRLDSIQFLCSQAHVPAGWRLELFFISTLHRLSRKHSLYCWSGVFTAPLHNNGGGADLHRKRRWTIVARVFVVAGICLPSRCLAMKVYSDFTIPAFGRHVTLLLKIFPCCNTRKAICKWRCGHFRWDSSPHCQYFFYYTSK